MEVRDVVALVSGGASGLGAATVRRWVAAGGRAVIADLDLEHGPALARELGSAVAFCPTDVSDAAQVEQAVERAQALGELRVAVSCAGIGPGARTVARDGAPHDLELYEKVLQVNLTGSFNILRLAASAMSQLEPRADGERGVVINTASVAAYDGQVGQVAYAASKGGVVAMTLPAARDLAPVGIRVMTIAPGTIDTPMVAGLPEGVRQSLTAGIPFPHRLGRPEEYAQLVESIVTNSYLNGEVIRLDGALRMPPK